MSNFKYIIYKYNILLYLLTLKCLFHLSLKLFTISLDGHITAIETCLYNIF